jgi:hypothetical protein
LERDETKREKIEEEEREREKRKKSRRDLMPLPQCGGAFVA